MIIDEADQMFDMGFMPAIRQIVKHVPRRRQTLLFSATMPDEIKKLARELLHDPITVQVGKTAPPAMINHAIYPVEQHLKTAMLLELLYHTDTESVLVFTRTKNRAKRLGEQLSKAGFKTASLQGNLSQNKRQAAMEGFRDGTYRILVATDIAARGIDVTRISHVINYDISDTPEAYIHRIGRTGRAEKSGDALTLVTREDTATVRAIEKILGSPLKRNTIKGFNYSMPAPRKDAEYARTPVYAPRNRRAGRARSY
jgi:ATP-dependent RNA helicase RhlE